MEQYNKYIDFGLVISLVEAIGKGTDPMTDKVIIVLGYGEISDLNYEEAIYKKLAGDNEMKIVPYSQETWEEIRNNPKEINEHLSKFFN